MCEISERANDSNSHKKLMKVAQQDTTNSSSSSNSIETKASPANPTEECKSWPSLHPLAVLTVMPLAPIWFWMNRGFTNWFHYGFWFYLLTGRTDFMRRFQVIIGGSVCIGWYLSVVHDYAVHGRFCHLLYNNMPPGMKTMILENGRLASGGIVDSTMATGIIALVHVLDFVAHPYLTYVAWKMHSSRGGSMRNLVTWDVLVSAYALRMLYSMSHQYYNDGAVTGLLYYGFDVYHLDTLDTWTAAYTGESLWFAGLIVWKGYLIWMEERNNLRVNIRIGSNNSIATTSQATEQIEKDLSGNTAGINDDDLDGRKPALKMSSSVFSMESSSDNQ